MSHTVVETSVFSTSVTVPDPGNFVTGASVEVAIQPLCNRTQALNDGKFASVTEDRVVSELWTVLDSMGDLVTAAGSTIGYAPIVPVGGAAILPVRLPHGSTINSFTVAVDPGAHASLPAIMPAFTFFRITAATGQIDNTGGGPWGGQDPSASTAVYNATHDVTFNVGITIDREVNIYLIRFIQESGANSTQGLLFSARVNVTTAQQDPVGIV